MAKMTLEEAERQLQNLTQTLSTRGTAASSAYTQALSEFAGISPFKTHRVAEGTVGAIGSLYSTFGGETPDVPNKGAPYIATGPGSEAASRAARGDWSLFEAADKAAVTGELEEYTVSTSGKIRYANGVIYDPESGSVLHPPGKAAPGSREWILKIQDEWTDKDANAWRKKLVKQGYEVAPSGGMALDLLNALTEFHTNRYANFGKVQPLIPTGKAGRESLRQSIDFKALKEEVKTWGQVPFGEDLDEDEADYFSERMVRKMVDLSRKHPNWSGEQIEAGAKMRVQKEFTNKPQVSALIQEQEDQEVSYKIRDSVLGVNQLLGA